MQSPYTDKTPDEWGTVTIELLKENPLNQREIVDIIFKAWDGIFRSKIDGLQIGKDIFPNPQMMGYFIETIVAVRLSEKYPTIWKHGKEKHEKDIVCLTNLDYSIEVKSSSSTKQIFGNRSYAQQQADIATKSKDSFYLTINFEKFLEFSEVAKRPEITLIRFGYVEHSDWRGQKSEKGQQASLSPSVYKNKFLILYNKKTDQNNE
jgi:hypothetical protein